MKFKRNKKKISEEISKEKLKLDKSIKEDDNIGIQWEENIKPLKKTFPGPQYASVPLRIAIDRRPFADLTAHVLESIDEEICGVLVGEICEDDKGFFVHVRSIIKGVSARQGNAHVTFTQETWNHIHIKLEQEFQDFHIVGWYHSHPGFGVLFSEMDLFIQRNFFPSPTQFALVMDPLRGEKALCVNAPEGIRYIDRFWIDGREIRTQGIQESEKPGSKNIVKGRSLNDNIEEKLSMVDIRLSQVLQSLEKQETSIIRPLIFVLAFFSLVMIFFTFYSFFRPYNNGKNQAPVEIVQYIDAPVNIAGKPSFLRIGIKYEISSELRNEILKNVGKKIFEVENMTRLQIKKIFHTFIIFVKKCIQPIDEKIKLFLKIESPGAGDKRILNNTPPQ